MTNKEKKLVREILRMKKAGRSIEIRPIASCWYDIYSYTYSLYDNELGIEYEFCIKSEKVKNIYGGDAIGKPIDILYFLEFGPHQDIARKLKDDNEYIPYLDRKGCYIRHRITNNYLKKYILEYLIG